MIRPFQPGSLEEAAKSPRHRTPEARSLPELAPEASAMATNPHQEAAILTRQEKSKTLSVAKALQLQGKSCHTTNSTDTDAAYEMVAESSIGEFRNEPSSNMRNPAGRVGLIAKEA